MLNIVPTNTRYDFIGKAPLFIKISIVAFVLAVGVIAVKGVNLGLDFTGGHELLIEFEKPVSAEQTRAALDRLNLGETSVQTYEIPGTNKTYYLVRVERSETFGPAEIASIEAAFRTKYSDQFKRLKYEPEAGDVIEVELADTATTAGADTSSSAFSSVVASTHHKVRLVRRVGRPDQQHYAIVLQGIDVSIVSSLKATVDPAAEAIKVEFVGPTVGKQLRDDAILALAYALLCMLIYIALRFDFFYSPGAIICLFHDAVVTVGLLSIVGEKFSLATIAGILTLVGYSINDTIIVFDRIRETVGKAQGQALKEIINRSVNETLPRTVMTSTTTLLACVCLMIFGRGTILSSFGLIMLVGIILGTYSSIYVAAPIFMALRMRFGPRFGVEHASENTKKPSSQRAASHAG